MKLSKLATTLGLCLAVFLGVYLADAGQAGNCNIGGETGPGVKVKMDGKQQGAKPAAPAAQQPKASQGQPAAAKPDQPAASQPGAAPMVPIIAPDEGC